VKNKAQKEAKESDQELEEEVEKYGANIDYVDRSSASAILLYSVRSNIFIENNLLERVSRLCGLYHAV
jgi:hypothetical protein